MEMNRSSDHVATPPTLRFSAARRSATALLLLLLLLTPPVFATQTTTPDTSLTPTQSPPLSEPSPVEADSQPLPESQPGLVLVPAEQANAEEIERRRKMAEVGLLILYGIIIVGLFLVGMVVVLGRRYRRLARQAAPQCKPIDPFWYLKSDPQTRAMSQSQTDLLEDEQTTHNDLEND